MSELLIELFSEEIPSRMQAKARDDFGNLMLKFLTENKIYDIKKNSHNCFVGPRRITFLVSELNKTIKTEEEIKRGPRVDAPKEAVEGFLKAIGVKSVKDLSKTKVSKNEYYVYKIKEKQSEVKAIITEELPNLLQKMSGTWANQMRWGKGDYKIKWVRPLQNILCLFDGDIVDFKFSGIKTNNYTHGHRFLTDNKQIKINSYADYVKKLKENFVVFNQNERMEIISKKIEEICKSTKLHTLKGDLNFEKSTSIISEAVGNTEYPVVMQGKIDKKFMDLPEKVLVNTIKTHQKYFCLKNQHGNLIADFFFVSNINTKNNKNIIKGNEKVLCARLNDAKFYIDEDLKQPLEKRFELLTKIIFHEKLESIYCKINRMIPLAKFIALWVPHSDILLAERAAMLAKADLTSLSVTEMPELQGYLGSYYAKVQGEDKKVCDAISEHYMPVGQNDNLPQTALGQVISLADKFDTIIAMFLIGEKPTSSRDPFALRRATIGIIRIIRENRLDLPLILVVNKSLNTFKHKIYKSNKKTTGENIKHQKNRVKTEIIEFFVERLKIYFKDLGYRADIINEVFLKDIDLSNKKFNFDIIQIENKTKQIDQFIKKGNLKILGLYKRASNIVEDEEKKIGEKIFARPNARLFETVEERKLWAKVRKLKKIVSKLLKQEKYKEALEEISILGLYINNFFNKVMVNCESVDIKRNRLELLSQIRELFNQIINFSNIQIDS
ncbi:glycine--tRNA ligase subunit beta [Pseudomonadota bacterium]